ncbi:MdtA/MuxA family multidrug efflux RND transporter periplasmic adaptor subunit [Propionivibrio dicarboxylicus]|uniref:Membrane fusion protein, multidrug efflux system n=1 Tax=Propionivibrio dicarboxylicus TaxID=83767 RepID=A0A1G7YA28_9RHOO|nr:MdtA/MuxA family multidrug efflux RND transporter periplasmic adaptor subunit [Propionivibrio dicarboxylicus]SDG93193.1 membrane fusion protein, multidrug efflux system [Propionivibrio dicarboxylicus]
MKKKTVWALSGVLLVAGAAAYYGLYGLPWQAGAPGAAVSGSGGPGGPGGPGGRRGMDGRAVPVMAAEAVRGDIDVIVNALGTVTARNTTVVKPRVDGQLVRIAFHEGQIVKAGELLAEIDPRPFQAVLEQVNGQLVRDHALLANALIDLERYRALLEKDSIARQQFDAQEALVKQYRGTVLADQGNLNTARLQLDFTRITAPISGRLGLRQVDLGNMVKASDTTGIVVITQTQPILLVFSIPADSLGAVLQRINAGETLQVEAWDRENKTRLAVGKLASVDNQIDTTTGTVKLKAEFANDDQALFPNQFVNAALRVDTRRGATLVPVAAVQRGTPGTFVYVIDPAEKKVAVRPVTLGAGNANVVAIEKGLAPGEQVVVDGADKLRQDAKVEIMTPESRQVGGASGKPAGERGGARRGEGKRPPEGAPAEGSERRAPDSAATKAAPADAKGRE